MANTSFASSDPLTIKKWSVVLFKQALHDIFFGKFVGPSDKDIIQTKTDLTKDKGDKIAFGLRMKLSGAGVTDDDDIEGSEEAMVYYDFLATLHLRANGVKAAGKMTLRRTAFDIKSDAKNALADWMKEIIDEDTVYALSGIANAAGTIAANAPSTNRRWYGGQTTGGVVESVANDAAIDSSTDNLFGTKVISLIKRKAQLATPKIRPVSVDGKDWYVIFVHPYQVKALKEEAVWLQAQREANIRGLKNPIFSGATGVWDNVIIHEYDQILTRVATEHFESDDVIATGMNVARALFCGAQAGVHAYGQYPGWYEKMFQYGRVPGVATDVILACEKTEFNSQDFGVITVDTAYVGD